VSAKNSPFGVTFNGLQPSFLPLRLYTIKANQILFRLHSYWSFVPSGTWQTITYGCEQCRRQRLLRLLRLQVNLITITGYRDLSYADRRKLLELDTLEQRRLKLDLVVLQNCFWSS